MKEREMIDLAQHLESLKPTFEIFCMAFGYQFANPKSIGRYPRIRIKKDGKVGVWIDLMMELDENGNRFTSFYNEIPYELYAGASISFKDGSKYGFRYQKAINIYTGKPFNKILDTLASDLKKAHEEISSWTEETLKLYGKKVSLG